MFPKPDEGPDENGSPLVRDCSCRGEAGHCHLPCLIRYASKDGEKFDHGNPDDMKLWHTCPNCCQFYCNDLRVRLADALLTFTKYSFPCDPRIGSNLPFDPWRYAKSLVTKMMALQVLYDQHGRADLLDECKNIASEIISVVDNIKNFPVQIYGSSILNSL